MSEKHYLVTGAAGFIGAAVAKTLLDRGHNVTVIDNLSTGYKENIPAGSHFIKGDCQSQEVIEQLRKLDFDAVYHIAGQSSGEISFEAPVYDLQTNGQSTLQLLQLCREIGCKKFIYASTMAVYGDVPDKPIDENYKPQPKSFYAVGKLASEHYLRIYAEEFGISTAALRLFNVYGPGQNLENLKQGMVSIFLAQAFKNKSIHVKGSKDRFRDFVYIDDVVSAFVKTEENMSEGKFLLFNVCSGVKTTIEELVNSISDSFNVEIPVKFEGSTPGDQFGIYGNNSLAKKTVLWTPKCKFKKGLKEMIKWSNEFNKKN